MGGFLSGGFCPEAYVQGAFVLFTLKVASHKNNPIFSTIELFYNKAYLNFIRYFILQLKDLASELVVQAQDKTLFDDSGMSKGTPRSARLNHKWFNREDGPNPSSTSTPVSPGQNKTPKSKPSTPKSGRTTPSSRNPLKRARDSTPTESPSGRPAKRARDTTPTTPKSERTTPSSRNPSKRARENTPTESPSGRPAKRARDTTPTTPNYTSQKYTLGHSSRLVCYFFIVI